MNSVNLTGTMGSDPDVKYYESGNIKATFSIAVKGFKKDETHWINLELWGKPAEYAANYLRKGNKVAVSGSLKTESWDDKDTGKKRYKTVVNVNNIEGLSGKNEQTEEEGNYTDDF